MAEVESSLLAEVPVDRSRQEYTRAGPGRAVSWPIQLHIRSDESTRHVTAKTGKGKGKGECRTPQFIGKGARARRRGLSRKCVLKSWHVAGDTSRRVLNKFIAHQD